MARLKALFIVVLMVIRNQTAAQRNVVGAPVILRTVPEHSQTAIEGSTTEIICTDHGEGRVAVHWTRGGDLPLPFDFKQTGGHLTIPVVEVGHQGPYICAPSYLTHGDTTNQSVFLHVRRKDECHVENEWSECDHNCIQTRVCHLRPANYTSDEDCDENQIESLLQSQRCPGCQAGGWGDWSDWTRCSESCGGGSRDRYRRCDHPAPRGGGSDCDGPRLQHEGCNTFHCPVDCAWTDWSAWSHCSASCGHGSRMRSRDKYVLAAHGGRECDGAGREDDVCVARTCPQWSTWTVWGACSRTCGEGFQRRHRACVDDRATRSEPRCEGRKYDQQRCSSGSCPVDGNWSPWGDWTPCSLTCGGGTRYRRRSCNNPPPSNGGEWCRGNDVEDEPCNAEQCPAVPCVTHGGWSAWSHWSVCSNITKTKLRWRSCDNPAPANGGSNCTGHLVERKNCSVCPCSVSVRLFPGRKNLTRNTPALFKCSYHSPYNESVNIRMTTTPVISGLSLHSQTSVTCGAVRRLTIIRIARHTAVVCEVLATNGTRVGSATFKISVGNGTDTTARPLYTSSTKSYGKTATTTEQTHIDPVATWTNGPRTDLEGSGVCGENEFLCASSLCIPLSSTCNGADDCGDNSDELACQKGSLSA